MADRLNEEELLKKICAILKDEFVAHFSVIGNELQVKFLNGQKFKIELTEI